MKILIADDDPVSRRRLETILSKWGYEVITARDGTEAWRELQAEDSPSLAILDWMMPGVDGPELCRRIRKRGDERYTYVIILTSLDTRDDLVLGMESGADDYVVKPFDAQELRVRLRAGRRILELQSQLIAAREALEVKATHDALTGLWNRAAILEMLDCELARSERENKPLCVVLGDIDKFKHVNDTYGHLAGDAVLRETARRATSVVRRYGPVGRYGGEEFLFVVPVCGGPDALRVAERIRGSIGTAPMDTSEGLIPVTISLGVAVTEGRGPVNRDALLRAADRALYQAKRAGRDRVELSSAGESADASEANRSRSELPASDPPTGRANPAVAPLHLDRTVPAA